MQQYPQRIATNAWHIAHNHNENSSSIGFSGTNDNHRLLPLQMRQYFPTDNDNKYLSNRFATNGKMLSVILHNTLACNEHETLDISNVLDDIVKYGCRALIDCSAILARKSNYFVAHKIIRIMSTSCDGVAFYDNRVGQSGWKVVERNGRIRSRDQSPIGDNRLFVLFDEPRCRGSDFKLPNTAKAILTLGPNMTKDKLMQSAGRMRKLEIGQKIIIVGTTDIFQQAKAFEKKSLLHNILEWVLSNTVSSNASSLLSWCSQGFLHATTKDCLPACIEDENIGLTDLYGNSSKTIKVTEAATICQTNSYKRARKFGNNSDFMLSQSQKIIMLMKQLGSDIDCKAIASCDEECERELELQQEEEEEQEVGILICLRLDSAYKKIS